MAAKKKATRKTAAKKKSVKKKSAKKKAGKRTTLYSSSGKKLYAVRDASGKFKDIQSYARAHAADLRKKSKKEAAGT
jgi:hypothetical protein